MSGSYIMVKWTPATRQDTAFSVAEISAFGGNKNASLIASSTSSARREEGAFDGKAVLEGRDFGEAKDAKEVPLEAPPAAGPPITLPDPPPFRFVPEVSQY